MYTSIDSAYFSEQNGVFRFKIYTLQIETMIFEIPELVSMRMVHFIAVLPWVALLYSLPDFTNNNKRTYVAPHSL